MNEIMVKVNELYEMLVVKNTEADAFGKKLRLEAEVQLKVTEVQAAKDADLKEREAKVEKVENVLAVQQKNKETLQKIMQEREKLATASGMHTQQVVKDKHEIEVREKGLKGDFATLKEREEKLKKDNEELAKNKEVLKKGAAFLKVIDEAAKAAK